MRIGMYGGFPPPICGEFLNNEVIYNFFRNKGYNVDKFDLNTNFNEIGKFKMNKLITNIKLWILILKKINKIDVFYITLSQSRLGFIRFFPIIFILNIKKKPYVLHLKGNLMPSTYKKGSCLLKSLINYSLRNARSVILLSKIFFDLEPYSSLKNKVHVDNFIESNNFFLNLEEVEKKICNPLKLRLFYLSNIMEEKGIFELLDCCKILKNNNIDFNLKIAGNIKSDIKKKFIEKIEGIGEKYIQYIGVVRGDSKEKLLKENNIFVLPTYYKQEGQPISILEAMASGNVIITTRHSGIPGIVKNNTNGFFVEKKSVEDLVKTISLISKDELKRISIHNIEESAKKYKLSIFTKKIEEIITGAS